MPWYASHRDLQGPDFCRLEFYSSLEDLRRYRAVIADADAVIVGSYVPEGVAVGQWVQQTAKGVVAFYDNLDQLDEASLVSWQVYQPQNGEKLDKIAQKFDMTLAELKRVNGIPARSSRVPKELVVPMNDEAKATLAQLPLMYAPPIPQQGPARAVHVVKKGDTLSSIAARHRVSVSRLKSWNPQVGRFLQVGQKIYIR